MAVTKKPEDYGALKTPTIRNVEFLRPLHARRQPQDADGRGRALQQGGPPTRTYSNKVKKLRTRPEQEKKDLVEFIEGSAPARSRRWNTIGFPRREVAASSSKGPVARRQSRRPDELEAIHPAFVPAGFHRRCGRGILVLRFRTSRRGCDGIGCVE